MRAESVVGRAAFDGVILGLSGGGLSVTGEPAAIARWRPVLVDHKAELLVYLGGKGANAVAASGEESRAADEVAGHWVTADTTPEAFAAIPVPDPEHCDTTPADLTEVARIDGLALLLKRGDLVVLGDREALQRWSATIDAWRPKLIDHLASLPNCRSCAHCKRQAFNCEGYCGGRSDLPPVYGDTHPLRYLPEDRGEACPAWAPET